MAKFCSNCGEKIKENQDVCLKCGVNIKKEKTSPSSKSKIAAGLLGIFFGTLGVHNFYLGYKSKAVAQLLLTIVGWVIIVGPLISAVWSFIEAIMILTGSIKVDAEGKELGE